MRLKNFAGNNSSMLIPVSVGLGGALNNSLGDRDHFEQQTFSSPVSLGHTSTPISSVRSGHEGAAGHQSIILML